MSFRRSAGFTLVELMITIVVLAILLAIAFPSFRGTLRSNRVASSANETLGLLSVARSEAIRNRRGGGVCGSASGTECDNNWGAGMLAWADTDGDGAFKTGDTVLRFVAIDTSLSSTGPSGAVIAFDGRGRRVASTNQQITLQPVTCDGQALRRTLFVNAAGQITSQKSSCQ
ncbi:GspH/FimT family pseudopilin [Xanthomonas oryzae pv. oryzicola]|uniref:Type II secretion system protein H n=2 Tax=Xanthomonas oryzae TaxID=347 RepID=A0AAJ6H3G0_9XANT|nr:Tfp pilus assembly protein FimT/FimU [Xanthomonas oryzae]WIX08036.1 Tfp pilus assembly protein FimT/FimU [Xanthomonas oryzae pv. oryzae]AEQ97004.1 pre-pilin like leader sequence [Xanthomonas oryzae pv. oryzicola BLS256]AJQ88100.1 pre-pilin like leader sequence [Xanthomonas oryzae pv. oryzicola]AKK64547.1 pre-pilin like leader sequence [Xanthomonas oryzae pv. oryzicola]AKN93852.1 pre-pilin like leader sequence [Xanthomonas oryzae pv. oryzicola]